MAIVAYTTYIPEAQPYVPGCPQPTILNAFQRTAHDFFHDSLAYRVWLAQFDLTINISTYTLAGLPTDTEVAHITAMYCQGIPVNPTTHEEFFALDPEWPTKTGSTARHYTALTDVSAFNITPVPEATVATAFNIQVAVTPTLTASGVEETFFEQWKDGIIDGVLARLMEMPGKTWTDPKGALARQTRYIAQLAAARGQANKGNTRRDVRVQMRRWV